MKILSWNVRGVGRKVFIQQVHELVNLYLPKILLFMETKINLNRFENIKKKFKFNFPFFIELPQLVLREIYGYFGKKLLNFNFTF